MGTNVPSKPGMQVCKPWCLPNGNWAGLGYRGSSDSRERCVTDNTARETETRARECDSRCAAAHARTQLKGNIDGDDMFLRNVSWLSLDTQRHIPEYRTLHNHRDDNLKSNVSPDFFNILCHGLLRNHSLSTLDDCLFGIFAATSSICKEQHVMMTYDGV
jgi:hypothetical protein